MNLYARLPDVLAAVNGLGSIPSDGDRDRLLSVVGQASEFACNFTGRIFHTETRTATYNSRGGTRLWLQDNMTDAYRADLVSVSALAIDEDGDGLYETTLVEGTDFALYPGNPTVTYKPARAIDVLPNSTEISAWPAGVKTIQVTGKFGYSEATQDSGLTGTVANGTATTITASGGADDIIYPGDTLLIESEQVYVTGVASVTLTVTRGVNGTTAAAHSAKSLLIRRYPEDLEWAVAADAARKVWHAASGYPGEPSGFTARWPAIRDALGNYIGASLTL